MLKRFTSLRTPRPRAYEADVMRMVRDLPTHRLADLADGRRTGAIPPAVARAELERRARGRAMLVTG